MERITELGFSVASASSGTFDEGFNRYAESVKGRAHLGKDEELDLARRWKSQRDPSALDALVTSHLRLVIRIASRFGGYGMPLADLVSEGNLGLVQGITRFDPEKGFRLSTYTMWWIRAAIMEYVLHHWSPVGLPRTAAAKTLFFRLRALKGKLGEYGNDDMQPSSVKAVSLILGVPEAAVTEMNRRLSAPVFSLDAPLSGDEGGDETHAHLLVDGSPGIEDTLAAREEVGERTRLVRLAAAVLNRRERAIVAARYLCEPPRTLAELASDYKVSRERIRQLEERALKKLRSGVASIAASEAMSMVSA